MGLSRPLGGGYKGLYRLYGWFRRGRYPHRARIVHPELHAIPQAVEFYLKLSHLLWGWFPSKCEPV